MSIGDAPNYAMTLAGAETPYLEGTPGDPFKHQHPQMAVDPTNGVIAVGFNATESSIGLPSAYVVRLLGKDGHPLDSQLGLPYFLADSPGGLGTSANYYNLVYSSASGNFVAAFNSASGITYATTLEIYTEASTPIAPPMLDGERRRQRPHPLVAGRRHRVHASGHRRITPGALAKCRSHPRRGERQ